MRTVFLGTSEFAASLLERLVATAPAHRPALVVSRPDRRAGRGRQVRSPPVVGAAAKLGIEVAQPDSVNDEATRALIAAARPRAVIVCAYGALIKQPLLGEHLLLNVHPSLLPRWRGAAPIERAIMAGDAETGVAIMRVTEGLDSGPVYALAREPIAAEDSFGTLAPRLERLGTNLLVDALDALEGGDQLTFAEQDERLATYAEKIDGRDRELDPERSAADLARVVRALHPHVGARLQLSDGSWLGVLRAAPVADAPGGDLPGGDPLVGEPPAGEHSASLDGGPYARDGRLLLDCSPGTLELLEVQPPGKRAMDASAYLRGHAR